MEALSVSDITRIFQMIGIIIAGLLILLIITRMIVWILRHAFRKRMSADNTDLIGQQAIVRRTVRRQRPGEIECEWKGQLLTGPAISEDTIRPGKPVLIYAAEQECFKVRPLEFNYVEGKYEQ